MADRDYNSLDTGLLSRADRIDYVCDLFEDQWLSDQQPAIHDFLDNCKDNEQSELFTELLLVEIEYRRDRGAGLSKQDYLKKFPEFFAEIEAVDFQHGVGSTVAISATETMTGALLEQGTRLAHFELLERIGSGGVGEVWKARDMRLKRIVAVKIPRHSNLSESELQRFQREGQTAAQLRHPNIVSIHEVGRQGKVVFIVSEYIDGLDLRESLQGIRLTHHAAAKLCAQLADALHHAHEHGVIHRDLKPANVLLDHKGKPHVTDFGLAKWLHDERPLTIEGQLLGTPAYMSPEQAQGDIAKVDGRSDVYSLGILLYELLTGSCPFHGDQAAVINAVIHQYPPPPRSVRKAIPLDLETICLKATEKEPERRYPSAQELALDLHRFLCNETIFARRASMLERGCRWVKRRPAIAIAVLFGLIALTSFVSVVMLAEENRTLLGLKTVTLTTTPAGAKITFVPLNKMTGEPMPDQLVRSRGSSPVEEDLRPGNYLVIAVLTDDCFHEVYRHVPNVTDSLPGHYNHQRWKFNSSKAVVLPSIKIPQKSVTSNMAFVSLSADNVDRAIYVDPYEFTVADYKQLYGDNFPDDTRYIHRPANYPMMASWDAAVQIAERLGKRLPTETEYQGLVDRLSIELGDRLTEVVTTNQIGPVGFANYDQLQLSMPIHGLISNFAEWTQTSASITTIQHAKVLKIGALSEHRIVRGGTLQTINGTSNDGNRSLQDVIKTRVDLPRYALHPGLGFRCVRSKRPRYIQQ